MKRMIALGTLLVVSVVSHADTETIDGYTWTYSSYYSGGEYKAEITDVTPKTGNIVIPSMFATNSVTHAVLGG